MFCCRGCQTVCEVIVDAGHQDFYKHRDAKAKRVDSNALPDILEKLRLYDNDTIQKEFVTTYANDKSKEAWLILEEIRCAACLWLNEKTLRQLDGVIDVQMDYTGQQARVRWQPDKIKLSDILKAITNIGYQAHPFDPSQRESLNQEQKQRSIQRIIFALILGMAVMQSAIASYFFGEPDAHGNYPLWITISRWSSVFATAVILLYSGQLFFRNAWRDIKNKTLGMDVPVAIGLSVAWLGSLYSTINKREDVYFESITMFVIFILVSRHIELRSRITATALLDRSAKIIPQAVTQIDADGTMTTTAVVELKAGDRIQVSPGETVPVDGILLSAQSSFDESLLTGESRPVIHKKGDNILGGTINVEQVIDVEVSSGRQQSTLQKIHQLTQKSIQYRPYYVDIAEKVAGKFVATVLLIALSTYLFWTYQRSDDALSIMISVLIVTCPCALALAAPVALSLSAAGLSRLQLLPIRMSSIEQISHIDTLVFDKTGTLTSGIPSVDSILTTAELNEAQVLSIAASLEQGSHHPFAKAIRSAASEIKQPASMLLTEIEHFPAKGVQAKILSNDISQIWRLGSFDFSAKHKKPLTQQQTQQIEHWRKQGNSVLFLSDADEVKAIFCIIDPLREGIKGFLTQLKTMGIQRSVILSGDHKKSVGAVAMQLGIDEFQGDLDPQQKLDWINQERKRQNNTQSILMIGDGVNDAPTLAAADVSLTFSEATDLAKSNCDFILLGNGYKKLAKAFYLMRKTRRIILQNLAWAIGYNLVAVPAAAMGFVTPWMAAIGMSLSSLAVIFNSMRLKQN